MNLHKRLFALTLLPGILLAAEANLWNDIDGWKSPVGFEKKDGVLSIPGAARVGFSRPVRLDSDSCYEISMECRFTGVPKNQFFLFSPGAENRKTGGFRARCTPFWAQFKTAFYNKNACETEMSIYPCNGGAEKFEMRNVTFRKTTPADRKKYVIPDALWKENDNGLTLELVDDDDLVSEGKTVRITAKPELAEEQRIALASVAGFILEPGRKYRLSAWCRSNVSNDIVLGFTTMSKYYSLKHSSSGAEWEKLSVEIQVPSLNRMPELASRFGRAFFGCSIGGKYQWVRFKDWTIEQIN